MTEPSIIDPFSPAARQMLPNIARLALMNPFDPRRTELAHAVVSHGLLRPERLPGDELLDATYRLRDIVFGVADVTRKGVSIHHVDCETGKRWLPPG